MELDILYSPSREWKSSSVAADEVEKVPQQLESEDKGVVWVYPCNDIHNK